MFCTNCGFKLETDARFCTNCGAAKEAVPEPQTDMLQSREPVTPSQELYMLPPMHCPYAPRPQPPPTLKKKPKIWIPIVASVAVLAVIAGVLLFVETDRDASVSNSRTGRRFSVLKNQRSRNVNKANQQINRCELKVL